MSRYRASLIHLLISALLVGSVIGIVYWEWYPSPILQIAGAFPIIGLLIGVDLVLGPLLTLIVYKHGKPGLKFDLIVIALVQIIALLYGSHRLYDEKPDYLVFAVDRIEFVAKKQVDLSALRFDEADADRFAKLIQVFARVPQNPEAYQRYMDSIMSEGKPDLERRPEYWEYWRYGAETIRAAVKPIEAIEPASSAEEKAVKSAIDTYADTHPNLGVLPIGGIERDIGMLVDRDTLELLDVLNANPWQSTGD